jgi:hypothetical protein
VAACLPYLLVSVFVESFHVVRPAAARAYTLGASVALSDAAVVPAPTDPFACPACAWLRVGTQQLSHISISLGGDIVPVPIVPHFAEWPDSPTPSLGVSRSPSFDARLTFVRSSGSAVAAPDSRGGRGQLPGNSSRMQTSIARSHIDRLMR